MRRLYAPHDGANLLLTFGGSGGSLTVWLDGKEVGYNPLGCLVWQVVVPAVSAGEHQLVVLVDNHKELADTFPRYGNDWAHYGGLTRSVTAAWLGETHIAALHLPYTITAEGVVLQPAITLTNYNSSSRHVMLSLEINGVAAAEWRIRLPAEKTVKIRRRLPPQQLALWAPERPELHTVRVICDGDDGI